MSDEEFTLIPVKSIPLKIRKSREKPDPKIDIIENQYLEKIGIKPKNMIKDASYIQDIYNRMMKEEKKNE
jgi:hypothetical protein